MRKSSDKMRKKVVYAVSVLMTYRDHKVTSSQNGNFPMCSSCEIQILLSTQRFTTYTKVLIMMSPLKVIGASTVNTL